MALVHAGRTPGPGPTAPAQKPDSHVHKDAAAACEVQGQAEGNSSDSSRQWLPSGGGWWELSGGEPAGIFRGDGMFSVLPRMVHTGVYA